MNQRLTDEERALIEGQAQNTLAALASMEQEISQLRQVLDNDLQEWHTKFSQHAKGEQHGDQR